ncbi:DUF4097 family beta strand repeat-containing protein [Nonomuraea indica]|uniref:DUF4097 family beta strand repeat-containing protein n=1 Tax=Nonomuraea indica TaxID=1581193 RepID=A0ABW8AAT1_9ACTN
MRALWLLLGTVATVIALTLATVGLYHGVADADPPTEISRRSITVDQAVLDLQAGSGVHALFVQAGEAGELVLERRLRWSERRPDVTEEWDGRTLRLGAGCSDRLRDGPICDVGYVLFVPPEAIIEVRTVGASLHVAGVQGRVRVTTVSGDVRVTDALGDVHVRSGSGDVAAMELGGGRTDVEVGSGDVELVFRQPPTDVRAVIRASGGVSVVVPDDGTSYDVTTSATVVDMDVRHDPGSPRKITAETGDGRVRVCCG